MSNPLFSAFRFEAKLRRSPQIIAGSNAQEDSNAIPGGEMLGDGAFQECSGLQVEMDVQDYQEGGRNDGIIRRVGWAKYTNIVLKRGMFYDRDGQVNDALWKWLQDIVSGKPVARYDGIIEVKSRDAKVVATWVFERGLPAKISGPQLNAKSGEIAIEELHIAHEGLRLVTVE
ncbi:phage tail protein [Desulfogranum marinum]|uniref:phage tail protein n=1 Tax=Desulfogranum marinum TaxID=453220 RepID=UPI0029C819BB|nr:phage tail protein [Desulfogranum marinum]